MNPNNLIVIKITPAGVEAFSLNPTAISVVVIDETKPSAMTVIRKSNGNLVRLDWHNDEPENNPVIEYMGHVVAHRKARWLGLKDYTVEIVPKDRANIELAQVLERLPAGDLEAIRKLYEGKE